MITPGLTNQSVAPYSVTETLDQIHELDAAVLTLQETGGTITADGTEQDLYLNISPLGCFRPVCMFVDLDNMQAGDTTEFRVYYRLNAGGALQQQNYQSYTGADGGLANSTKVIAIDLHPSRFGSWITLRQTAGTNRTYDWEVFTEG